MEITISCTKKQALLIQEAMEEYFKIRLNQFDTLANALRLTDTKSVSRALEGVWIVSRN